LISGSGNEICKIRAYEKGSDVPIDISSRLKVPGSIFGLELDILGLNNDGLSSMLINQAPDTENIISKEGSDVFSNSCLPGVGCVLTGSPGSETKISTSLAGDSIIIDIEAIKSDAWSEFNPEGSIKKYSLGFIDENEKTRIILSKELLKLIEEENPDQPIIDILEGLENGEEIGIEILEDGDVSLSRNDGSGGCGCNVVASKLNGKTTPIIIGLILLLLTGMRANKREE